MGCDIHIYVERKRDGKWEAVSGEDPMQNWFKKQYEQAVTPSMIKYYRECYEEHMKPCYENWIYDGRNYRLFSLLANVRNGIKKRWMGIENVGHFVKPISVPKGLPDDASEVVKEGYSVYSYDGRSKSFLTLQELIDGTKNDKKFVCRYLVSKEEYVQYKVYGYPNSWSSWSNARLVSNFEMEQWIAGIIEFDDKEFIQTVVEWEEDMERTGVYEIIKKLKDFCEDPENIRIVFWFDN